MCVQECVCECVHKTAWLHTGVQPLHLEDGSTQDMQKAILWKTGGNYQNFNLPNFMCHLLKVPTSLVPYLYI